MEITRRIIYHEKKEAARKSGSIFKRIKASGRGRFPLMKVSGPIEAHKTEEQKKEIYRFPLMKVSGPIEADGYNSNQANSILSFH